MSSFQVGDRVEAAFSEEPTAFYPGKVTRVRANDQYDILFDDGDVLKQVSRRLIRLPAWWWLDEGEDGVSPHTRCHHRVNYRDSDGQVKLLKSGDLVVVKNNVKKHIRHRDREIDYFVAEIICFFEEYDADDVESQRVRAKNNPFARFRLDTDVQKKRDGTFATLYPNMELRWFYFPEEVFKDKSACKRYFVGEIFETDDVVDGCHLNDILDYAVVLGDKDAYINSRATQGTQAEDMWDEDNHMFLCQYFYDIQAKRLRNNTFDPDDSTRGRPYSRHLFQAVVQSQSQHSAAVLHEKGRRRLDAPGGSSSSGGDRKRSRVRSRGSTSTSGNIQQPNGIGSDEEELRRLLVLAYNELQLSAVPHSLPCRENERRRIYTYLRNAISTGGRQSTLYVSGLPGTGKTATLMEVVRILADEVQSKQLPSFKFVMLNAMQLTHPLHAYRDILFKITGEVRTAAKAAEALKQVFSEDDPSRPITLLLVDEIDFLSTRKQEVLYNLFEWPSMATAKLLVVGIANTMDLPERLLPKISSRASMERVDFASYTKNQIVTILKSRLGQLPVFEADALEHCAHKVTSVSGDIRRALQLCRRAIELRQSATTDAAVATHGKSSSGAETSSSGLLSARDIHAADLSIRASHHYRLIAAGTYFERVALVALVRCWSRCVFYLPCSSFLFFSFEVCVWFWSLS